MKSFGGQILKPENPATDPAGRRPPGNELTPCTRSSLAPSDKSLNLTLGLPPIGRFMRGGQPSFAPNLEANLLSRKLIMSKNRRILVIDDNLSVHTDFRKILCPVNREPTQLQRTRGGLVR